MKLLLSHGANVNATTGDVRMFLFEGPEFLYNHTIHVTSLIDSQNEQTPLMFASLIGDMEMVRLILKYHPVINARSKVG